MTQMQKLAKAVVAASAIHDGSFNTTLRSHDVSICEAARRATDDEDVQHVTYLLLSVCWNDAIDWANQKNASRATDAVLAAVVERGTMRTDADNDH